jgi:hypothetical protein
VCEKVLASASAEAAADGEEWLLIDAGGGVVVDLDEDGNEVYSQRKVGTWGWGENIYHFWFFHPFPYLFFGKKEFITQWDPGAAAGRAGGGAAAERCSSAGTGTGAGMGTGSGPDETPRGVKSVEDC